MAAPNDYRRRYTLLESQAAYLRRLVAREIVKARHSLERETTRPVKDQGWAGRYYRASKWLSELTAIEARLTAGDLTTLSDQLKLET